ncbi:MAG: glutaredoxin family protein [Betaproteobacteria bacterium]
MTGRDAAPSRRAPRAPARRLTLLSRAYCHLCDDMRAALAPLLARRGIDLVEIDVDTDPALDARFGERVPVLLAGDVDTGQELCHYVLDPQRLRDAL